MQANKPSPNSANKSNKARGSRSRGQSADELTRPSVGDMEAERASGADGVLSADAVEVGNVGAPKGSPIAKIKGSAAVAGQMRAAGRRDSARALGGAGTGTAGAKRHGATRSSFASGSLGTQL